jgi:hypothetical protein
MKRFITAFALICLSAWPLHAQPQPVIDAQFNLYYQVTAPGSNWTAYSVPIVETAGWRKDTPDGPPPTQQEMIQVLSTLQQFVFKFDYSYCFMDNVNWANLETSSFDPLTPGGGCNNDGWMATACTCCFGDPGGSLPVPLPTGVGAAAKYLGDQSAAYGGTLTFDVIAGGDGPTILLDNLRMIGVRPYGPLDHFDVSTNVATSQVATLPINIMVVARDATNNLIFDFTGPVNFSAILQAQPTNTLPIVPTVSGAFTNGVWAGNVSIQTPGAGVQIQADDGNGHMGQSNPFNVAHVPVFLPITLQLVDGAHVRLFSPSSHPWAIQSSPDLQSWVPVFTNVLGTNDMALTNLTDQPAAFFRATTWP